MITSDDHLLNCPLEVKISSYECLKEIGLTSAAEDVFHNP